MKENNAVLCSNCNQSMLPVDLQQVPGENLRDFIGVPGNKLEDNWLWCSECDSYEQSKTPAKLSPEIERLKETLEYYSSAW